MAMALKLRQLVLLCPLLLFLITVFKTLQYFAPIDRFKLEISVVLVGIPVRFLQKWLIRLIAVSHSHTPFFRVITSFLSKAFRTIASLLFDAHSISSSDCLESLSNF